MKHTSRLKQRAISAALTLALIASAMPTVFAAQTQPSDWAKEDVSQAIALGLVPDNLQGNYQGAITRLEFCQLAVNFIEVKTGLAVEQFMKNRGLSPSQPFADCSADYVLQASALGITNGRGDNQFAPDAQITREEAATMLYNLNQAIFGVPYKNIFPLAVPTLSDKAAISVWAEKGVRFVRGTTGVSTGASIMQGTAEKMFTPKGTYTVEQSILTIYRLYHSVNYHEHGVKVEDASALDVQYREYFVEYPYVTGGGLFPGASSQYDFVLFGKDRVVVYHLDGNLQISSKTTVAMELNSASGVHQDESGNYYLVFTQENREESTTKEVLRLVQYDKSWRRLSSASVTGGTISTTGVTDAGGLEIADNGAYLTIHTSRTRFASSDGLNHQSNLTLTFRMSDLGLVFSSVLFPPNHVSHSFHQDVLYDGDALVTVDLGDAYPRALVLQVSAHDVSNVGGVTMYSYPGPTGQNYTGVTSGGLVESATSYIVSYNTIDQNRLSERPYERSACIAVVPKDNLSNSAVKNITLTSYAAGEDKCATAPLMVSLTNDRIALIWEVYERKMDYNNAHGNVLYGYNYVETQYVVIDGSGRLMGDIQASRQRISLSYPPVYRDGTLLAPSPFRYDEDNNPYNEENYIYINRIDLSMFDTGTTSDVTVSPGISTDTGTGGSTNPGSGSNKGASASFTLTDPATTSLGNTIKVARWTPLLANITGDRALIDARVYASSDESVAFVTQDGIVIGVGAGTADISLTIDGVTKSVTYIVDDRLDEFYAYDLSPLMVGKSRAVLSSRGSGSYGSRDYAVESFDESIASISHNGNYFEVTGVSPGTTQLKITLEIFPVGTNVKHPTVKNFYGYVIVDIVVR